MSQDPQRKEPPPTPTPTWLKVLIWSLVAVGAAGALAAVLFLGTCFLMASKH